MPLSSLLLPLSALGKVWQDKALSLIIRWNIVIVILQLVYLFLNFNALPPQVPLFYSLPWGDQELANAGFLFFLPLFSLVVFLLNGFIAVFISRSLRLLSRILFVFSLVFALLASISLVQIVNLVI